MQGKVAYQMWFPQKNTGWPIFMATWFLLNISLTNCVVAIFFYGCPTNDHMKRGFDVNFDTVVKISKYNLRSASGGCAEGTYNNLRDKYHSWSKVYLKTSEKLWWVKQAQFSNIVWAEISGSLKLGLAQSHSSWLRNACKVAQNQHLIDLKHREKVISCWSIQAPWTHEIT